jgi:hypothetical protein
MSNEMRTNRVMLDEPGRISDGFTLNIKVRFDLIETQDFMEGKPGLKFVYGNLRYEGKLVPPRLNSCVLCGTRVSLRGAGIQTAIRLINLNAFTVMSAISETT